jgi:hypothetical protein
MAEKSSVHVKFYIKVKKPVEITLKTIHLGAARRITALEMNENAEAESFLREVQLHHKAGFDSLRAKMRLVADELFYKNENNFRNLDDGLFEFKSSKKEGLRLYAFYDDLPGVPLGGSLIIATSGSGKSKQKQAIARARRIREEYLAAKILDDTTITIIP